MRKIYFYIDKFVKPILKHPMKTFFSLFIELYVNTYRKLFLKLPFYKKNKKLD